jgi:hypothetical protein
VCISIMLYFARAPRIIFNLDLILKAEKYLHGFIPRDA